jgi:hypothetical protein
MLQNLIDQNLNINNNLESQIQHVINVALLCVHTIPTRRPSMMHVLAMLLGEKEVEVAFRESLGPKKNYSFMSKSSNQSFRVQIWQFATQIVLQNFGTPTMAWLNLKQVGTLIIHDTMTHLCLWAIEQLVAMICTLHNTFVLSFGINLSRIILKTRFFKSSCKFAHLGTFFNTSQQLMKVKLQCIKC